jgi:uncharacterized membrane protein (DUF373 family)
VSDDERPGEGDTDKEELPEPDAPEVPAPVTALGRLQDLVYYAIAILLVVVAGAVMVHTAVAAVVDDTSFAERVTEAVNGVLFVVIVLELLRTVLAHFQDSAFHLKPFLIIGIISVVRHILTASAELSLQEEGDAALFQRVDIELGVNALVVLVLVLGLVFVRKTE